MAHTTNKITAPVTLADIQAVIGNSSIYLGTLCAAGTVNKWAKYKPVKLAKVDTCDELDSNDKWLPEALRPQYANGCIQILPSRDGLDGFFIARLRRKAAPYAG